MKKKLLALMLALVMTASVLPMGAFAADDTDESSTASDEITLEDSTKDDGSEVNGIETGDTETADTEGDGIGANNAETDDAQPADTETDANSGAEAADTEFTDEDNEANGIAKEDTETDLVEACNVQAVSAENSLTSTAASSACTHQNAEWYYTEAGHSLLCKDCKQFTSAWEEHTLNGEACTVCGYRMDCEDQDQDCICDHCGAEYHYPYGIGWWQKDAVNHVRVCERCNKQITVAAPHSDANGDGACDECYYMLQEYKPCTHQNTEWRRDQYGHTKTCADCNQNIVAYTKHAMSNGECTECGYSPCAEGNHSFVEGGFSKTLGETHECQYCGYYDVCWDDDGNRVCDTCGTALHEWTLKGIDAEKHQQVCAKCNAAETTAEPHNFLDGNGICHTCHYGCQHLNLEWVCVNGMGSTPGGHMQACSDCHESLSIVEEHIIHDGSCTVCGYVPCEHTFGESGYSKHCCERCNYTSLCVDINHDCICDICERETHPSITYVTTAHMHQGFCEDCGCPWGNPGTHYDENADNKCDECGYQMKDDTKADEEPEATPDPGEESGKAEGTESEKEYEEIPDTSEDPEWIGKTTGNTTAVWQVKSTPTVLSQYQALYKENTDLFGWITIAGTQIDYPVMHTSESPEKYQSLDFEKSSSEAGTPYINADCDFDSDNIIVYANNMEDGSMFHGLLAYQEREFWEGHPVISFDTIYEEQEYVVLAAFYVDEYAEDNTDFQIDDFTEAKNKAEFDEALSYILEKAIYDTDVDASYGDKLITLITDAENAEDGRFVVVAKKK